MLAARAAAPRPFGLASDVELAFFAVFDSQLELENITAKKLTRFCRVVKAKAKPR
jgi:hypothetical protein